MEKLKALLVGSGAREHAIAERMAQSAELYAFMSAQNPGIAKLSKEFVVGNIKESNEILKFALHVQPDYVFIGPEDPLANGATDVLLKNGIKVCSPTKGAARLESDKGFCRTLLKKYIPAGIPKFAVCNTVREVDNAMRSLKTELVVKPSGLTGGKGVKIQGEHLKGSYEVRKYAYEIVENQIGGMSTVVLEEKLEGEEFSLQAFTDGKKIVPMPLVQDHKRAFENDEGPNTGGMGSYSDKDGLLPFVSERDLEIAVKIMGQSVAALETEHGIIYKGVLYGGFMLTKNGPKLLEYNARFGDPEAMNVLPLLKTDFNSICMSIIDGRAMNVDFEKKASVCKYLVPKGYPDNPLAGAPVDIDESAITKKGAKLYYASVDSLVQNTLLTTKSRSFGIVGFDKTISSAEKIAQAAVETVESDKLFYRRDIGTAELIQKRIKHMAKITQSL